MNATELRAWCAARRGRPSELARRLQVSRQLVWQWAQEDRPIPAQTLPTLIKEARSIERGERVAA